MIKSTTTKICTIILLVAAFAIYANKKSKANETVQSSEAIANSTEQARPLPIEKTTSSKTALQTTDAKELDKNKAVAQSWITDFAQAQKEAANRKVPILANFSGSDWCGWCIRLDEEVFSKPEFKAYAEKNLVLFVADFPQGKPQADGIKLQNQKLADQ